MNIYHGNYLFWNILQFILSSKHVVEISNHLLIYRGHFILTYSDVSLYVVALVWSVASFNPSYFLNGYKLTCAPVYFGVYFSDTVPTWVLYVLNCLNWLHLFAGMFKTTCFSFTRVFLTISPYHRLRNKWIIIGFNLSWIKWNPGVLFNLLGNCSEQL